MAARVYLDTNIFIRAFERDDEVSRALTDLLATDIPQPAFATSELTLAEILVHPYRNRDNTNRERYDSTIRSSAWLLVGPVEREVLTGAALLRSKYRLKLPDAIHVSTALHFGCTLLLTDDGGMNGKFDFSYWSPGQHWPTRTIESVPLNLLSIARATEHIRA